MSQFGDGTFKQDLLDAIENVMDEHNIERHCAAGDVAHVLAYICDTAFSRDKALQAIRVEAVEQAKSDLTAKLRGMIVTDHVKLEQPEPDKRRNPSVIAPKRRRTR